MPRVARVVNPECPHHIVLRGNNRRRLCSYPSDFKKLLSYIAEAARRTGCQIHGICVMSNHLHLIVSPPTAAALAAFVKRFAQRYAQYRNRRRDGSGKLFEERFWSDPILTEAEVALCMAYVELNPVDAGMVREPGAYRWSSYRLLAAEGGPCGVPASMITPTQWYLDLGSDAAARAREYRAFVAARWAAGEKPERLPPEPAPPSGKRVERPNRKRAA